MSTENSSQPIDTPPRRTSLDLPRFLVTVIVTGLGTLVVVGFFLFPQLGEGSEEWRNKYYSRLCRQAQSELSALPPDQRLVGQEVLGRVDIHLVTQVMATTCIGPPRLGVFVATRCPGMGCSEENNECQRGLGRVPPNIIIVELSKSEEWSVPVRAALTEPGAQIVRVFVPRDRDISAPLTNGRDDYTIENAEVYLAQAKWRIRREWITFLTVWIATWAFLSWQLLIPKEIKHETASDPESEASLE
jgi:hypothetical protein